MKLTAEKVSSTYNICLFKPLESTDLHVAAEGVTCTVGFHPGRLGMSRAIINDLLDELPETFHEGTGDGWSFLEACMDKDGNHWGEHTHMEQLFQLGVAIGRVTCLLPRDLWHLAPGGVPYYVVHKRPSSILTEI